MGCRVIIFRKSSVLQINNGSESPFRIVWQLLCQMYCQIIFLNRIKYFNLISVELQCSGISNLSAGFGIERGSIKNQLEKFPLFPFNFPVTVNFNFGFECVVSDKPLTRCLLQFDPVACFKLGGTP